ncbi:hypothetical protein [Demequina flava]|uniref:hypothetical protein n=1 Tax=Demequina flava TaxID=1095025 RepID=UPI000783964D|nr:hypothetical protein [Demequina flava]
MNASTLGAAAIRAELADATEHRDIAATIGDPRRVNHHQTEARKATQAARVLHIIARGHTHALEQETAA